MIEQIKSTQAYAQASANDDLKHEVTLKHEPIKKDKPHFNVVYAYALKQIKYQIRKLAKRQPDEIKEEIAQDALLRVWQGYQDLDPDKGWKSYIQRHCRGAVLDYNKAGKASTESEMDSERLEIISKEDQEPLSVEDTVALFEVFAVDPSAKKKINPNWDLVNRMIYHDENLHIVAKVLCGYTQEQIAEQMQMAFKTKKSEISRERISQRIQEFFIKLDDPREMFNPWVNQCIFALGMCELYFMPTEDNGQGWTMPEFDANLETSFRDIQQYSAPALPGFL